MIRLAGKVQYSDGRTAEFETGSAALAEYELYALRHGYPIGSGAPPMLSSLVVAHHALGIVEGFDAWRKTVVGVELDTDTNGAVEVVPPTLTDPSSA